MNAHANVPATRRAPTEIEILKGNLTKRVDEFKQVLPAHITPEKFQRVVATAALQNPQLLACDRQSLLLAAMKLAQDGLIPDGREAALVPFKTRVKGDGNQFHDKWLVQPMPMVYGLRKKILQSGEVLSIETGVVYLADYESGRFLYEVGLEPPIRYRPDLLLPIEETSDDKIVAAYSIAKIKNEAGGDPFFSVEVMRRAEIDKVRQTSQTGAVGRKVLYGKDKGKVIEPKGPWVDWFGEMARKTVLRRHSKVLPMSGDILDTFERDIEAEREADTKAAESATAFLDADTSAVTLPSGNQLQGAAVVDKLVHGFENADSAEAMRGLHQEWSEIIDRGELDDDDVVDIESAFEAACQRLGIDPETGEVLQRDSRGMSEVDETTARKLDAQGNDGALSEENPNAREGRDDSQMGEQHANGDRPEAPYLEGVRALRSKLAAAKSVRAVEGIDRDWCNGLRDSVEQGDENLMRGIDRDIADKKRKLQQAEAK